MLLNVEMLFIPSVTRCQFHQRSTLSFYRSRSQKCKKIDNLTVFFALSGYACTKAACRMLMKSTPGSPNHKTDAIPEKGPQRDKCFAWS